MEKDKALSFNPLGTLAALGALALTANYLSALWLNYPFVYCLAAPYAAPLYIGLGTLCLYASAIYVVWHFFSANNVKMLGGIAAFVAIIELPNLADYALRLGGSCG